MFTEALSLATQMWHMLKTKAKEGINSSYLGVVGVSRFMRIFFWTSMSSKASQFWYLIAADVVHSIMTLGFMV